MRNSYQKGIYLVTEKNLVNSQSGAGQHISVGLKYLSENFEIKLITNDEGSQPFIDSTKKQSVTYDSNKIKGALRDLKILWNNLRTLPKLYKKIKQEKPEFIYERSAFLNANGLIISKLLRIPHFYENNGIAVDFYHNTYYASAFHKIALWLERNLYSMSNYVFYVGTWGYYFNSSKKNWLNIENGIEQEMIDHFNNFRRVIEDNRINIGFIGNPMAHHRLDLLVSALNNIDTQKAIHLHLIGPGFTELSNEINVNIIVHNHGYVPRDMIVNILKKIDIGIIPNAFEYLSQMKLFDYGVAKSLVICPNTINLKEWFTDDEVLFFDKLDFNSLKGAIELACEQPTIVIQKGENLYKRIQEQFSWNEVFGNISSRINQVIKD